MLNDGNYLFNSGNEDSPKMENSIKQMNKIQALFSSQNSQIRNRCFGTNYSHIFVVTFLKSSTWNKEYGSECKLVSDNVGAFIDDSWKQKFQLDSVEFRGAKPKPPKEICWGKWFLIFRSKPKFFLILIPDSRKVTHCIASISFKKFYRFSANFASEFSQNFHEELRQFSYFCTFNIELLSEIDLEI